MTRTSPDPVDGRPVRTLRAGTTLVPAHLAWRRLGVGHRTETWLTWSVDRWAPCVVKLPRPDQLDHPRARTSLVREADALTRAAHPALPRLLDDHARADLPWLVLAWLDGTPLDAVLAEHGPLPVADALSLAAQLTAALRHLHAQGLAHLDLTPANVMVHAGWPVLIDLGAARPFGEPLTAGAVGTPGYAAPELDAGAPAHPTMDLHGLGAVLRDALADGSDGSDGGDAHPLAEVVTALLDPDPTRRPPTADAVLAMLADVSTTDTGPPWPPFAERRRRGQSDRRDRRRGDRRTA